jgi:hypothetical protein
MKPKLRGTNYGQGLLGTQTDPHSEARIQGAINENKYYEAQAAGGIKAELKNIYFNWIVPCILGAGSWVPGARCRVPGDGRRVPGAGAAQGFRTEPIRRLDLSLFRLGSVFRRVSSVAIARALGNYKMFIWMRSVSAEYAQFDGFAEYVQSWFGGFWFFINWSGLALNKLSCVPFELILG